ncbi:hypothetical protein BaRGS_00023170, partial [Batillaria attramentaria]
EAAAEGTSGCRGNEKKQVSDGDGDHLPAEENSGAVGRGSVRDQKKQCFGQQLGPSSGTFTP